MKNKYRIIETLRGFHVHKYFEPYSYYEKKYFWSKTKRVEVDGGWFALSIYGEKSKLGIALTTCYIPPVPTAFLAAWRLQGNLLID